MNNKLSKAVKTAAVCVLGLAVLAGVLAGGAGTKALAQEATAVVGENVTLINGRGSATDERAKVGLVEERPMEFKNVQAGFVEDERLAVNTKDKEESLKLAEGFSDKQEALQLAADPAEDERLVVIGNKDGQTEEEAYKGEAYKGEVHIDRGYFTHVEHETNELIAQAPAQAAGVRDLIAGAVLIGLFIGAGYVQYQFNGQIPKQKQ